MTTKKTTTDKKSKVDFLDEALETNAKTEETIKEEIKELAEEIQEEVDLTVEEISNQSSQLESLKSQASLLGISFTAKDTAKTISNKIKKHNEALEAQFAENATKSKGMTLAEKDSLIRNHIIKEKMRLLRVRITNMNPAKINSGGEWITISNKYIGEVSKFIPFNMGDEPYHIPFCIYEELKSKKFAMIPESNDRTGIEDQRPPRLVPEFAIEVLPPLTEEEIAKLAQRQKATRSVQ